MVIPDSLSSPDSLTNELSPPLSVKEFVRGDESRWDDFVRETPGGTFYHLSGWRSIAENHLNHRTHYIYCESGADIQAVLPLVHVSSFLFGDALISLPFLVYGGPVASNSDAERLVVEHARSLARELNVDHLELRNRQALSGDWQVQNNYATFRKKIDPLPEKNLLAIPRKQRAMIRKGIKAGLIAELDQDVTRLHSAMLVCKRNLGTPFFSATYLQAIKDTFADQVEITTVIHAGTTVCSVMSFRFRNEILPYYGGGGDLSRDLNGNDFMYWAVMERACQEGVEIFDYGRSMVGSGAYRFKKHWGFEPELLSYQYFLVNSESIPNLNPSNPRYRFLIKAWKMLPLSVAAAVGPFVARRLG
jgi:FemAB-related protein (PEP-CTERM system-associated)